MRLDTEVVIVGAGPTGLMLAVVLARLGVPAVVLDRKSGPTTESRAILLQARSMELYDQLGIAEEAIARSGSLDGVVPGYGAQSFRRVPLGRFARGTTPFPRLFVLEQSKNEVLLGEHLQTLGGEVLWNADVASISMDGDGVLLSGTVLGEPLEVRAQYCVGADGTNSVVRAAAGLGFEGATNPQTFYVADAQDATGIVAGAVNLRLAERDLLLAFPMVSERVRLLGVVPDADGAAAASEPRVRGRLARTFGVQFRDTAWYSTYRVHHRVASAFRSGRLFVAGDAAHVHSPVGAQGMNTGLQDAHNLAIKLAAALRGEAPESSLDRYSAERRPVALRLVSSTDRVFRFVTSTGRVARFARRNVVRHIMPVAVGVVSRFLTWPRIFEYLSQTRIHYWMSPTAKRDAHGRRGAVVGRRLPWNGDNFACLRAFTWQVHGYGLPEAAIASGIGEALGLPMHLFVSGVHSRNRSHAVTRSRALGLLLGMSTGCWSGSTARGGTS